MRFSCSGFNYLIFYQGVCSKFWFFLDFEKLNNIKNNVFNLDYFERLKKYQAV